MLRLWRALGVGSVALASLAGCVAGPPDTSDAYARDEGASTPWLALEPGCGAADAGAAAELGIPCEIELILQSHCRNCHGESVLGAPTDMATLADFQRISATAPPKTVASVAYERIRATGPGRMPPVVGRPLSRRQVDAMIAWLGAGAPPGPVCPPAPQDSLRGLDGGSRGGGIDAGAPSRDPDARDDRVD